MGKFGGVLGDLGLADERVEAEGGDKEVVDFFGAGEELGDDVEVGAVEAGGVEHVGADM